jgi:hypothetical protein
LAIECLLILAAAAAAAACSSQDRAGPGDARYQRDRGKQVYKKRRRLCCGNAAGRKGRKAERAERHRRVRVGISSQPWEDASKTPARRRQDAGRQEGRSGRAQAGAGWAHTGSGRSSDE